MQPRIRAHTESLTDNVFQHLAREICEGRYSPGEALELAEIAQELGISRMPVREAIRRLVPLGLVDVEASRWTRVAPVTPASTKAAAEFAAYLAGGVARVAIPKLAGTTMHAAASAELAALVSATEPRDLLLSSTRFVSALARAAENEHLLEAWNAARITLLFHVGHVVRTGPSHDIDVAPTISQLKRAFEAGDGAEVATHLEEFFLPAAFADCRPAVEEGAP